MSKKTARVQERTALESFLKIVHSYAYAETLIITSVYLLIGYLIDPTDVCILNSDISYILILLAIITLFHGFENGLLTLAILATAMWYFYPLFQYIEFLIALLMTMIFAEFHYYWTQKIKDAEINADYRGEKLDELSKAFYSLKISHDQLEKNYVIKPMSIRNSIEYIINKNRVIHEEGASHLDKRRGYYKNFLELLEKSFSVSSALIIYNKEEEFEGHLEYKNADIVLSSTTPEMSMKDLFEDYLIDKSIGRSTAIFISDELGEPSVNIDTNSEFIAAIPAVYKNKVIAVLAIRKMPFMAFNREMLTSISILLDYFSVEINKKNMLSSYDEIDIIENEAFRFEYYRLKRLYEKYKVNSIILVLRVKSELQSVRIYEKIVKMLRSLDMVTMVETDGIYYIVLLFPLHDKSAALGYLNRLTNFLDEEKDKEFNYMTFDLSQTSIFNKYLREDYGE